MPSWWLRACLRASRRQRPSASPWKRRDTWSYRPPRCTQAPRPVVEYLAPLAPVSESVAPNPVAECRSPAPAVCTTPAAVTEYVAAAPITEYGTPAPVTECVIPSPAVTYTTADTTGVNLEITDFMNPQSLVTSVEASSPHVMGSSPPLEEFAAPGMSLLH